MNSLDPATVHRQEVFEAIHGKLAETASAKKPGLKVLLTSGYAWNGLGKPGQGIQGPDLLPKPSTYATLATKIRHVLDRGAAGGRPRQE